MNFIPVVYCKMMKMSNKKDG